MQVIVINASPRPNGNTRTLVNAFIDGAKEAGHDVRLFNTCDMNISSCKGCMACQSGKGNPCVQEDDMQDIYEIWENADVVVFASPVYWMSFTAQFMYLRDRLFAATGLQVKKKDAYLLATAASPENMVYPIFQDYYDYLLGVLGFKDKGRIIAGGATTPEAMKMSEYYSKAYQMGKSVE